MAKWTDQSSAEELQRLIADIPALSKIRRQSADHVRWMVNTLHFLEEVFGRASRYYLSFAALRWHETGSMILGGPADPEGSFNPNVAIERRHQQAYVQQLDFARGLLEAALDDLKRSGLGGVYEGKDTGPESSALIKLLTLIERKLRKVIRAVPSKERDVQDAIENLLVGAEIEYSRETDSIEYSSKTYCPDFTFQRLDVALDVKLCNRDAREKEVIAEMNDDILAYRTKYGNLLFVIYDLGFIRDIDRFTQAFESQEGVVVRVVKQ